MSLNNSIATQEEIKSIEVIATRANESRFFANLNGHGGIFSIAMFARELGLPIMQCLFGGMTNIQGKIEVSPRMMNAMIRKAGHKIKIVRSDDEVCVLKGTRKEDDESYECSYTMQDASKAGLSAKKNYQQFASDMLFARCVSKLCRRLFPDVVGAMYVTGEIDENEKVDPVDTEVQEESHVEVITVLDEGQLKYIQECLKDLPAMEVFLKEKLMIPGIEQIPSDKFDEVCSVIKRAYAKKKKNQEDEDGKK